MHRDLSFDLAHHSSYASDWMPAGVVGISGLPAVWGPVGGTSPSAWKLRRWLGARGLMFEMRRSIVGSIGRKIFGDWAANRAAVVLAQNPEVARRFAKRDAFVYPTIAISEATRGLLSGIDERVESEDRLKRAVFLGRLLSWKGLLLSIEALSNEFADGWCLDVFGSGPLEARARRCVSRLGLEERVRVFGRVSRRDALVELRQADAFIFPSMHDSASWAVGEAIVAGVPVVCLDLCGPPNLLRICGGGGVAVEADGDIPANLARGLDEARPCPNIDPLLADRLPEFLRDVYGSCRADSTR